MLNLQIKLGSIGILTILNFPIHEHGISLYLALPWFLSIRVLYVLLYKYSTYFIIFIPMYFILGTANITGIMILISDSNCSLLVSVQFSSVAQSCLTLCDPMDCSSSGLPIHHQLPELTQTHAH